MLSVYATIPYLVRPCACVCAGKTPKGPGQNIFEGVLDVVHLLCGSACVSARARFVRARVGGRANVRCVLICTPVSQSICGIQRACTSSCMCVFCALVL